MSAPTWSAGTPSGIGCVGVGDGVGLGLGQSSGVNAPVVVKNRNAATPAAAATSIHLERRTRIMQPPTTFVPLTDTSRCHVAVMACPTLYAAAARRRCGIRLRGGWHLIRRPGCR